MQGCLALEFMYEIIGAGCWQQCQHDLWIGTTFAIYQAEITGFGLTLRTSEDEWMFENYWLRLSE